MNIVLTGFMASGKTQISKAIAAASKYKVIDTDDMIVQAAGKSINRIFDEDGETEFRRIERDTICRAAALDGYVIATGGGVPTNRSNMDELRKNGIIVNLAPSFDVIRERLSSARASRPLLRDQGIDEIKKRFDDRKPFYDDCDIKINIINGRTPRSYAIEILAAVREYTKKKK